MRRGFPVTLPETPILETERLVLHRLTAYDAAFMLDLLNQPSFIRFIGDRGVRTLEDAILYIRDGPVRSYVRNGFGMYLVELKETAESIGICGLLKRPTLDDVDVGFAFLPAYWSQGYAFESARAVLSYAKDVLGLPRVVAIAAVDNGSSIKLLEKLGLRFERRIRMPGEESELRLFAIDL